MAEKSCHVFSLSLLAGGSDEGDSQLDDDGAAEAQGADRQADLRVVLGQVGSPSLRRI